MPWRSKGCSQASTGRPLRSRSALLRKLYSSGVTDSSKVTWKSKLKSEPSDEYQGNVQPIRALKASIFAIGAREMQAKVVPRAFRCERWPIWSAKAEQLGQPMSRS